MKHSARRIHVFEMTDEDAQGLVAGLLSGLDGLTVVARNSGEDHFLMVECPSDEQAQWTHRLVTAVDTHSVLLHTTTETFELFDMV